MFKSSSLSTNSFGDCIKRAYHYSYWFGFIVKLHFMIIFNHYFLYVEREREREREGGEVEQEGKRGESRRKDGWEIEMIYATALNWIYIII